MSTKANVTFPLGHLHDIFKKVWHDVRSLNHNPSASLSTPTHYSTTLASDIHPFSMGEVDVSQNLISGELFEAPPCPCSRQDAMELGTKGDIEDCQRDGRIVADNGIITEIDKTSEHYAGSSLPWRQQPEKGKSKAEDNDKENGENLREGEDKSPPPSYDESCSSREASCVDEKHASTSGMCPFLYPWEDPEWRTSSFYLSVKKNARTRRKLRSKVQVEAERASTSKDAGTEVDPECRRRRGNIRT